MELEDPADSELMYDPGLGLRGDPETPEWALGTLRPWPSGVPSLVVRYLELEEGSMTAEEGYCAADLGTDAGPPPGTLSILEQDSERGRCLSAPPPPVELPPAVWCALGGRMEDECRLSVEVWFSDWLFIRSFAL